MDQEKGNIKLKNAKFQLDRQDKWSMAKNSNYNNNVLHIPKLVRIDFKYISPKQWKYERW